MAMAVVLRWVVAASRGATKAKDKPKQVSYRNYRILPFVGLPSWPRDREATRWCNLVRKRERVRVRSAVVGGNA